MHEVGNINPGPCSSGMGIQRLQSRFQTDEQRSARSKDVESRDSNVDRVELSELGAFLASSRDLPDVRAERVTRVRAQILAGTYETPDKIKATVDRLLDEIG